MDNFVRGLRRIYDRLWRLAKSAPLAVKLIGLALFPLALGGISIVVLDARYLQSILGGSTQLPVPAGILTVARYVFIIVGGGATFGLGISIFLVWLITHQLHHLVEIMKQVESGDLEVRAPVWANDEIGQVQTAFNVMVESLQRTHHELQLQHSQLRRLASEKEQLLKELQKKETELRRALQRAVEYQEAERKRISRELHDEVGQALTSILIRLKALQDETDTETIAERLDGLRYLTSESIEELRRLAVDLRPAILDHLGILPALRWYIQQLADQSDLTIQFIGPEKIERLPEEIELVLYRVAQEGLTNAIRHSQASQVEVVLEQSVHVLRLRVVDDGKGFDPQNLDRGLGLVGIRERVELLKGKCGVDTTPGEGTRLWVEIPLPEGTVIHA
jgi:signal transduction histidine kinase